MILRTWRGEAATIEAANEYKDRVENTIFPEIKNLKGHIGAYLFSKKEEGKIIVLVMTYWEDMQAVKQFSGDTINKAVVEPRAQAALEKFDDKVEHFELVVNSGSAVTI